MELHTPERVDLMEKPKTASEVLSVIRDFISDSTAKEVMSLWHTLTALRGPDYLEEGDETAVKAATTEVIRHFAIGDSGCDRVGSLSSEDTFAKAKLRKKFVNTDHFWVHAQLAFASLNLEWDKDNTGKDCCDRR